MREILFRGKRLENSKWVYGNLVDYSPHYKWTHINYFDKHDDGFLTRFEAEVDPSTVGQYTGLADKNRKKIFEGDVVEAVIIRDLGDGTQSRKEIGIIGYDKIGMIGLIAKYNGTISVWSDFFQELTLSGCIDDFWFEVIGNIHDNPGLLENL